jgi:UDP-N-acetylmuramate--alanine ligase
VVADDPGAAALGREAARDGLEVLRVGAEGPGDGSDELDLVARDLAFQGRTSAFDVVDRRSDTVLGRVVLQVPGRHYVLDAVAALGTGLRLGHGFDDLRRGLEGFTGTRRRMEAKGEVAGVRVYDSYAHHPSEIAADLAAARAVAGTGRLVVAFQPHLVSRTKIFGAAMGAALGAADQVVVLDVYLAREDPEPGVDGALVAGHVPLPREAVRVVPGGVEAAATLADIAVRGDLVLTLGAGDVTQVGPEVLRLLGERSGRLGEGLTPGSPTTEEESAWRS